MQPIVSSGIFIPFEIMVNPNLTPNEKFVASYIKNRGSIYLHGQKSTKFVLFESNQCLAARIFYDGKKVSSITNALKRLEKLGYLIREFDKKNLKYGAVMVRKLWINMDKILEDCPEIDFFKEDDILDDGSISDMEYDYDMDSPAEASDMSSDTSNETNTRSYRKRQMNTKDLKYLNLVEDNLQSAKDKKEKQEKEAELKALKKQSTRSKTYIRKVDREKLISDFKEKYHLVDTDELLIAVRHILLEDLRNNFLDNSALAYQIELFNKCAENKGYDQAKQIVINHYRHGHQSLIYDNEVLSKEEIQAKKSSTSDNITDISTKSKASEYLKDRLDHIFENAHIEEHDNKLLIATVLYLNHNFQDKWWKPEEEFTFPEWFMEYCFRSSVVDENGNKIWFDTKYPLDKAYYKFKKEGKF